LNKGFIGFAVITVFAATGFCQTNISPTVTTYSQLVHAPSVQSLNAVYVNTAPSGYFLPGGHNVADDLHLSEGGLVNGFEFAYFDNGAFGDLGATVTFSSSAGELASFSFEGLTAASDTAFAISVDLAGTGYEFLAPQDITMAIEFNRATTGWLVAGSPTIGSSADAFHMDGVASTYSFGGSPKGNFYAAVYVAPEPGTYAAFATGLVGLLGLRRRSRK